ncbi:MAG: glycosyltransferase [Clostridia bacterium]|nr:glycosyltransferase [Clostridia bacterium]
MVNEKKYFNFSKEPGKQLSNRIVLNDGEPLISIITPYYNSKKYLQQTANSIFNQTFPYFEWIIVNDGSTEEDTTEFLSKFANQDNRIKILNKENGGPASARFFGVENATADIIYTMDADDLIDNTLLECGYWTLTTNKKATWAYSNSCAFGEQEYLWCPPFNTMKEKKENLLCGSAFIRKDKFLELPEYTKLPKEVHEDWYMWLKFLSKGYLPIKMNFYGFWYRRETVGRLNAINSDKEKSKIAESYLEEVAKNIKKNVGAIQFPITTDYCYTAYPKELNWSRLPITKKGEKKRILCIFPWSVTGGADIFNLNLIKVLKGQGFEITMVTTESTQYILRHQFEENVDEYFDLTTFLKREDWAGFIHYIIKSRNIDLVFESNSFYGYYVTPWLKCKFPEIPFVDYLHAEDWSWRDGGYPRDSIAISCYLEKTYTCTRYLKEIMHDKMEKRLDNTKVLYIGVDTKHFDPDLDLPQDNELKEKYKDKKILLFPCRLEYLKRPIFMVELMKIICSERKDIICLFIGDGSAKDKTLEYIKKYDLSNYIKILGMKSDVRPYYKIGDITIISSLTEGLTLTAYESLSMGVPVISSDVGGQKELVNDSNGKIIKTYQNVEKDLHNYEYSIEELEEYKNAIYGILDKNDKDKIEQKKLCRENIIKNFDTNKSMEQLVDEFNDMIKTGSRIDKSICENIEIAERILILYNELNKNYYKDEDSNINENVNISKKQKIRNFLWRFKFWRGFIKVCQKFGIIRVTKKIRYIIKR